MRIHCVIVDDEPRAHKVLENYILRLPKLLLLGTFLDGPTALNFLQSNRTDLIFLDITMPEMSGFGLLEKLSPRPQVIFTTAHSKFALESYEYNAIDYLKKPISFERFCRAIEKLAPVVKGDTPGQLSDHIDLRIDGAVFPVPFSEIRYFQSLGNYVKVITRQKMLLSQITTKEVEDVVPRELFVRIHKSYIVNKALIDRVTEESVIVEGISLPIGKTFKRYVLESIRQS